MKPSLVATLVTVTHNSAEDLRRFWSPIRGDGVEWVVVDNASHDDSVGVAESLGARVIRLAENVGFGAACNVGMKESRGEVIGFVNPDVAVRLQDVRRLADHALNGHQLVAPQLLNTDGTPQPNGRGAPTLLNKIINRLNPRVARDRGFQIYARDGESVSVEWLTGAAIFAPRELLESLGGFDETFFVYYEDVDLCIRARQQGAACTLIGSIRWVHGWAREAAGLNIAGWKLEASGALSFYRKYPGFLLRENALESAGGAA